MLPETLTQAYHAGIILSMVHNKFPNEKTPSFVEGVVHFSAMRELLGERMWQKICSRRAFRPYITRYLKLTYQPGRPRTFIGTAEDFALGYIASYKKSRRKRDIDKLRLSLTVPE